MSQILNMLFFVMCSITLAFWKLFFLQGRRRNSERRVCFNASGPNNVVRHHFSYGALVQCWLVSIWLRVSVSVYCWIVFGGTRFSRALLVSAWLHLVFSCCVLYYAAHSKICYFSADEHIRLGSLLNSWMQPAMPESIVISFI